jgi:beta-galactosidase
MFDYNRGYSNDLEASGIMSIDRIPKFSYYFYKSQRDATEKSPLYKCGPMVRIASWWTLASPLDIRVFSNCDEVELLLNGERMGKQKPDSNSLSTNIAHPPFTFKLDAFEPGELVAKAYLEGEFVAENRVVTPGETAKLILSVDISGKEAKAGSNDVLFVHASLVDDNGTVVRTNKEKVYFKTEGDAILLSPDTLLTEAGIATALIRIGNSRLPVKINATSTKFVGETLINVH